MTAGPPVPEITPTVANRVSRAYHTPKVSTEDGATTYARLYLRTLTCESEPQSIKTTVQAEAFALPPGAPIIFYLFLAFPGVSAETLRLGRHSSEKVNKQN